MVNFSWKSLKKQLNWTTNTIFPLLVLRRLLGYFENCCLQFNQKMIFFIRWPGKAHNARVWSKSPLSEDLADLCYVENKRLDETYHILGDSAYPLSNHLITPYRVRDSMTTAQKKFNTNLASKRSVIECAFGLLGLRFPRLMKLKVKSLDKRIKCIVSACVLHNWCIIEDDCDEEAFEEYVSQLDTDVTTLPATAVLGRKRAIGGGMTKRDMLCEHIDAHVWNSISHTSNFLSWKFLLFYW